MTYPTDLLTVNAFIISSGGTGGHATMLSALNELLTLQSVTAGKVTNLAALNALAVGLGATGGYVSNLAALNAISLAIGGTGGYHTTLAAWTEIAGLGFIDSENIIQKLDFSMDADKKLLLDVSGLGNHAKLVASNCYNGNGNNNFSILSNDPVGDNLDFYDFSVEFNMVVSGTGIYVYLGRSNGAVYKNLLSCFAVNGTKLYYYSGNGSASTSVEMIPAITLNQVYNIKASVSNSTGAISWIINGTIGSASFTNRTPNTNLANDIARICGVLSGTTEYYKLVPGCKVFGVKYYTQINYTDLTHFWPIAEGNGVTVYDVVGNKDLTLSAQSWSTQDEYHYNLFKGFQLYGNSDINNTLIRVPFNNDGTTKSPIISGFTKFSDCPPGFFNNFAETGVKRNYNSVQALTDAGISNTNVIFYGHLSGSSGRGFCRNYMGLETEYTVFSTVADRKVLYGYQQFANYIDDTVTKVLLVGSVGKIHNTNIKYCVARTVSGGEFYDIFVRNGNYNLTNPTTELSIIIPNQCGIIGESINGCIINGHLPADTPKAVLGVTSTFHTNGTSFKIANLKSTARNMRYVCHDDNPTISPVKRIFNVSFKHLGNHDAVLINPLIFNTCDAYGSGFQDGLDLLAEDSLFEGYISDGGDGRGYASHSRSEAVYTNKAILRFNRCIFRSVNGEYSFRWSTGATGTEDELQFDGCDFNGQKFYFDPAGNGYEPNADKFHASKKEEDIAPVIYPASTLTYLGLQISVASNRTLSINNGTVATLLFLTPKTLNSYSVTGRKNISETITGNVPLKSLLGNCSSVNKVLSLKIDNVDVDLTFNQDYSSMTNAQVISSINGLLAGVTFSQYSFCSNAAFTNSYGADAASEDIYADDETIYADNE